MMLLKQRKRMPAKLAADAKANSDVTAAKLAADAKTNSGCYCCKLMRRC
jgi:hypothetical protein